MVDFQKIKYFTRPNGYQEITVKCSVSWEPLPSKEKERMIKRAKKEKFSEDNN